VGVPEPGVPGIIYSWDFGDGKAGNGPEGTHVYEKPGRYNVVLTVKRDDLVLVGTLSVQVKAGHGRPQANPIPEPYGSMALGIVVLVGAVWFVGFTDIGLFSLGWALMLLYSKIARTKVLDNFLRGKIYGYILANPGDHYNAIMDALKLSNGTFAYHIRLLEREELVKSQLDGVYKRFYPAEMIVPTSDRMELTRIQRIICDIINEKPGINQREVAALLNLSSATVNYHIDTLLKKNHVRRERVGMKVRYYPVPTGRPREDGALASMLTPPL
jgi:predicted transcriptional regulator